MIRNGTARKKRSTRKGRIAIVHKKESKQMPIPNKSIRSKVYGTRIQSTLEFISRKKKEYGTKLFLQASFLKLGVTTVQYILGHVILLVLP